MSKFINPFTDVGFKRIFGQEINKDLLLDFLNALLEGERQVKSITLLDKEQIPLYEDDRGLTYDVYCTDENGDLSWKCRTRITLISKTGQCIICLRR